MLQSVLRPAGMLNARRSGYAIARHLSTTPDFNTSVDVHKHSISLRQTRAEKLKEMTPATTGSLIPDSIKHVEEDEEHITTAENLKKLGQAALTREERIRRRRALDQFGLPTFADFLAQQKLELSKKPISILQMNIGLYCNQACNHCHVESSPKRKEMMSEAIAKRCMELMERTPSISTVDITVPMLTKFMLIPGGAPELNDQFKYIVKEGRRQGKEVIDRCNLTVLSEPGQEGLAQFLADNQVRIVASLPCYSQKNVDTQRGKGVFGKSIQGLLQLNQLGYGVEGSGLSLDLIYNPIGPFLPPEQSALEAKYRQQLADDFGIQFTNLFTLSNMPIKRFADFLHRRGELAEYMDLLVRNFNATTVPGLMCVDLVSVGYDGTIYDCDFNQQLSIPSPFSSSPESPGPASGSGRTVFDIEGFQELVDRHVAVDSHCFGCTAGNGSSCQGATV